MGGGSELDQKILQEIKQKKFAPLYLFYGVESFLMEETCQWFKKQLNVDADSLSGVTFDLTETPIQELVLEAETLPFLSERRLIIGRNAEFLSTSKSKVPHQLERLVTYLEQPEKTSIVILTLNSDKLDKRKKVVKSLLKKASVVTFPLLTGSKLLAWIQKRVKYYGLNADEEAMKHLAILVGNNLRQLDQECKKLAAFLGKGGHITVQEIDQLVPRTLEQDVFQLINQLAARQLAPALQVWYDLLHQKEEPIRILALIIRQLRLMFYAKLLSKKGKTTKEIASLLQVHPYPVKLALQQSQRFAEEELSRYLAQAIRIDQEIKSGQSDKEIAIEQFLLQW